MRLAAIAVVVSMALIGKPPPRALGGGQDIGGDAVTHVGVEMAAATVAALHFIENQQRLMAVAQFAHPLQEFGRGAVTPPSPWIGSRITAQVRSEIASAKRGQIVERNMGDAGRQRLESPGCTWAGRRR